jgi:hypothetical protein
MDKDRPATKAELDLTLKVAMAAQTDELKEFMRQIETDLLPAFHGYGKGQNARMHTLEVTDDDLKIRLAALEDRMLALEARRQ